MLNATSAAMRIKDSPSSNCGYADPNENSSRRENIGQEMPSVSY